MAITIEGEGTHMSVRVVDLRGRVFVAKLELEPDDEDIEDEFVDWWGGEINVADDHD